MCDENYSLSNCLFCRYVNGGRALKLCKERNYEELFAIFRYLGAKWSDEDLTAGY